MQHDAFAVSTKAENGVMGRFMLVPFIPGDLALRAAQHT